MNAATTINVTKRNGTKEILNLEKVFLEFLLLKLKLNLIFSSTMELRLRIFRRL